MEKQKYTVVFDNGKPYSETYEDEETLKEGLEDFYNKNKHSDSFFDAKVFNSKNEDITETQFIQELIGEIIFGEEDKTEEVD